MIKKHSQWHHSQPGMLTRAVTPQGLFLRALCASVQISALPLAPACSTPCKLPKNSTLV